MKVSQEQQAEELRMAALEWKDDRKGKNVHRSPGDGGV